MNCGENTLQVIIDQYAHQYGPVALLRKHIVRIQHLNTMPQFCNVQPARTCDHDYNIHQLYVSNVYASKLDTFLMMISKYYLQIRLSYEFGDR
jgi:hypothetical protein